MSDKVNKDFKELFHDSVDVKEDGSVYVQRACPEIVFGRKVSIAEEWTTNEEVNVEKTDTLGYIPLAKQVERLIQAGEDLVYTKLREGTYSNDENDTEFHDNLLDDFALRSLDELENMYNETQDNFYTKKALLSKVIRDKSKETVLSIGASEAETAGGTPAKAASAEA